MLDRLESRATTLCSELGLTGTASAKLAARLGSADGEAAARGIEALQAIGNELDRSLRALLASAVASVASDEAEGPDALVAVLDLREGNGYGEGGKAS
jgi:hypothetical protein